MSCGVEAGSVTGLLGPSGSGKTTLLRAISA
jgi:ABC-2 type transport system ATP-binding protein